MKPGLVHLTPPCFFLGGGGRGNGLENYPTKPNLKHVGGYKGEPQPEGARHQPGPARAMSEEGLERNIGGHAAQPDDQHAVTHPGVCPSSRRLCQLLNNKVQQKESA